jgi:hypothetical protein
MLKKLREWLRHTPHFHVRERSVSNLRDLVALIDRFIDDKTNYALEWDDFISWIHANQNIEQVRIRILATERLFLSKDLSDRRKALSMLIDERNRAAALIDLPVRSQPDDDQSC